MFSPQGHHPCKPCMMWGIAQPQRWHVWSTCQLYRDDSVFNVQILATMLQVQKKSANILPTMYLLKASQPQVTHDTMQLVHTCCKQGGGVQTPSQASSLQLLKLCMRWQARNQGCYSQMSLWDHLFTIRFVFQLFLNHKRCLKITTLN